MKKIWLVIIAILIEIVIPYNVYAKSTTEATSKIDITKDGSLTLNYYYDNYNFDNTNVKIYYVASVTNDFQYQLAFDFSDYPIEINNIKTNEEWKILEQTLDAYIVADNINANLEEKVINNKMIVKNLKPGLYFVKTDKIDTDDYMLLFDSFLISIPDLNEFGSWHYDAIVNPKVLEYTPKYEQVKYMVIKQWIDDGKNRPLSIDIDIYKDGVLIEKKVLSSINNWTYEWTVDDDGSSWTVVERNVNDNYRVSITNQGKNFIIINKDLNYKEENPKTWDDINLYFYILIGSLIGIILLVIGMYLNKKDI